MSRKAGPKLPLRDRAGSKWYETVYQYHDRQKGQKLASPIAGNGGGAAVHDRASLRGRPGDDGAAIQGQSATAAGADDPSRDTVFQWTEIPQDQQVTLTRAVFDQSGYQLYDAVGETIIVPFTGHNLYVMKFGRSGNGRLYFVNDGGTPTLYVPKNGYLENATAAGARWYPFSKDFHPEHPVYLGVAPSYSGFVGMGWYPGMYAFGGYWSSTAFISGGVFGPSAGTVLPNRRPPLLRLGRVPHLLRGAPDVLPGQQRPRKHLPGGGVAVLVPATVPGCGARVLRAP